MSVVIVDDYLRQRERCGALRFVATSVQERRRHLGCWVDGRFSRLSTVCVFAAAGANEVLPLRQKTSTAKAIPMRYVFLEGHWQR
jgi:hypothetical protein